MSWACRFRSLPRRHHTLDKACQSLPRASGANNGPSPPVDMLASAASPIKLVRATNTDAAHHGLHIGLGSSFGCRKRKPGIIKINNVQWPNYCASLVGMDSALQTTVLHDDDYYSSKAPAHNHYHRIINREVLGGSILRRGPCNKHVVGNHSFSTIARFYTQTSHCCSNEKHTNRSKTHSKIAPNNTVASSSNNNLQHANDESQSQSSQQQQPMQQPPSEPAIHNISYLPPSLHPYAHLARLDKPIGTFLLLHPCLWSTALATYPLGSTTPNLSLCAIFGIGSFIMRGAGCTINDMWDSQYDKNVERTKSRPLASGELTYPQAWKFLALQLSAGLGVLLSLPHLEECFVWGVASLPLVATYPLMKRYTNYPQLALGLTFNWGAIMGWVAVRGEVDWSVVGPLYASGVAWTLVYDTLYAHQDKQDDEKLGLKSTALTFGEGGTKPILTALTGVTWGGWMMAGYNCGFGDVLDVPYYYCGVSAATAHLLWQIYSADLNDSKNLAYRFRSNNLVGWMVFGSCVAGNMMAG
ncbi:hypothetical protein ACHAXR_004964 [Thalassiosira sp. AJA248-18]